MALPKAQKQDPPNKGDRSFDVGLLLLLKLSVVVVAFVVVVAAVWVVVEAAHRMARRGVVSTRGSTILTGSSKRCGEEKNRNQPFLYCDTATTTTNLLLAN